MRLAHILIIAGSDSSGGAGIVRDIETSQSLACKASIAISAVSAQTHQGVVGVQTIAANLFAQQIETALATNPIAAIKIGMIASVENVGVLQKYLPSLHCIPVVFDPVLAASSGGSLAGDGLVEVVRQQLLNHIDLITPNIAELAKLTDEKLAQCDDDAILQAQKLLQQGAKAVLVKGGHLHGVQALDYLVRDGEVIKFAQPRLPVEMRGTGCTLSTAISCYLAQGKDLLPALSDAKNYLFAKLSQLTKSNA